MRILILQPPLEYANHLVLIVVFTILGEEGLINNRNYFKFVYLILLPC